MGALQYAGSSSSDDANLATKRAVDTTITNVTPNQTTVQADVAGAIKNKAVKSDVDKWDLRFAPATEFKTKDEARNVPKNKVDVEGAPCTTTGGLIPAFRFPSLGSGYILGPYGWTVTNANSTNANNYASAVMVASLTTDQIPAGKKYWPLCFGQVMVMSEDTGGKPVIDIRATNTTSGRLLATGEGRSMYIGAQGITALPAADMNTWLDSGYGYSQTISMWMYDLNGRTVSARNSVTGLPAIGGAVYILVSS